MDQLMGQEGLRTNLPASLSLKLWEKMISPHPITVLGTGQPRIQSSKKEKEPASSGGAGGKGGGSQPGTDGVMGLEGVSLAWQVGHSVLC